MRLAKILLPVLTVLFFLTACNKNIDFPPGSNSDSTDTSKTSLGLPKTYTEEISSSAYGNSKTTYNLSYDASGRLVLLAQANDPTTKMVYKYDATMYTLDIYGGGEQSLHEEFYLNSSSLVDSTFQWNVTEDTTTEKYAYNAQKQMTSVKEFTFTTATGSQLDDTHTYAYDNLGNQTSDTDDNSTQSFTWYNNYDYQFTIGGAYFPQPLHLIKGLTVTSGGDTQTAAYVYVFDDQGRISSEQDAYSNGDQVVKTYTY